MRISQTTQLGRVPTTDAAKRLGFWPARWEKTGTIAVDPSEQYVAGGYWAFGNYGRPLPWESDDIQADFGWDIYYRMLLDPQVRSAIDTLIFSIVGQGIHLQPAVDEDDPDYDAAVRQCEFFHDMLSRIPFVYQLTSGLIAMALGYKIAEQVYEEIPAGEEFAGLWRLQVLKWRPQTSTAFVMDSYTNCIGLLGLIPGMSLSLQATSLITDVEQIANLLPLEKFFVLSWQPQDDDPRGVSILRPAYAAWNDKSETAMRYKRYLAICAAGLVVGNTPPGADTMTLESLDADGNPILDNTGQPTRITVSQAMLNNIVQMQDLSAAVFPAESQVRVLELGSNGDAYLAAMKYNDAQIDRAITGQTLATNDSEHQAKASSETHREVMSLRVSYGRMVVADAIRDQILRRLAKYNWGQAAERLAPKVSLMENEKSDFSINAAAVAQLATSGYLDPRQYQEIDAFLGLPQRPDGGTDTTPPLPAGEDDAGSDSRGQTG
jgi:hypothetical protein